MIRYTHPETVGLNAVIPVAFNARTGRVDAGQQATLRFPRNNKRVHPRNQLVMPRIRRLDPIEGLIVAIIRLSTHDIVNACCCKQIALVSRINKDLPRKLQTTFHTESLNRTVNQTHALKPIQPFFFKDCDLCKFFEPGSKNRFSNMGFKKPHGVFSRILSSIGVGIGLLDCPCRWLTVVLLHALIKLT